MSKNQSSSSSSSSSSSPSSSSSSSSSDKDNGKRLVCRAPADAEFFYFDNSSQVRLLYNKTSADFPQQSRDNESSSCCMGNRSDVTTPTSPFSVTSALLSARSTDSAVTNLPFPIPFDITSESVITSPHNRKNFSVPISIPGTPIHQNTATALFTSPPPSVEHHRDLSPSPNTFSKPKIFDIPKKSNISTKSDLQSIPKNILELSIMSFLDARESFRLSLLLFPQLSPLRSKSSWYLWDTEYDFDMSDLSPSRFYNRSNDFFGKPSVTESNVLNFSNICHHITLGTWWNNLSSEQDNKLFEILANSNLKSIRTEPGFYICPCSICRQVNTKDLIRSTTTDVLSERVDMWLRETEQREGEDQRPPLSRMTAMSGGSFEVLASPLSADTPLTSFNDTASLSAEEFETSSNIPFSDDFVPKPFPMEAYTSIAKRHSCARFLCLLRLMFVCRNSLEEIDLSGYPKHLHTMNDNALTIPKTPLDLKAAEIEFPKLRKLSFGLALDCRLIVPILDFCKYPVLQEVQILGLWIRYEKSTPKFGIEPTMVFAPQQIFAKSVDPNVPMWMPAVYNGPVDDMLQLQGMGVYVSREYSYEGNFKDGRNHGWGRMVSKCGETYEGYWEKGRRCGYGVVYQASGRKLEGEWIKDVLTGRGTMHTADGLQYHGEWLNGALDGWGVLSKNSRLLAVGQFTDGKPNGWMRGKLSYCGDSSSDIDISISNSALKLLPSEENKNGKNTLISTPTEESSLLSEVEFSELEVDEFDRDQIVFEAPNNLSTAAMNASLNYDGGTAIGELIRSLSAEETREKKKTYDKFIKLTESAEWRDVWRVSMSPEEKYGSMLELLRTPQDPGQVLLLNPQLQVQKAGLAAHSSFRQVPEVPEWVMALVEELCTLQ